MNAPETDGAVARCPIRADYNPFSPEVIADPISAVTSRASEDPVFYSPAASWWTVSRYDDVVAVLNDTKRFSSAAAIGQHGAPDEVRDLAPEGDPTTEVGLINSDPPTHRRLRQLANQVFNPREVKARAAHIEQLVDELLDRLVPMGECDIVAEFAVPLPITVFSEMLGIPREDHPLVHGWSNALMDVRSPLEGEKLTETWRQIGNLTTYLDELIAERRRQPQDDYITKLIDAQDGNEPMLSDREILVLVAQIIPAGNETTRYLLAALALRLAENPDLAQRLRDAPELIEPTVEEELRCTAPAKGLFRVATEDVELGGATIHQGDVVQVYFAAANYDENLFEQPEEFRIDRQNVNKHVAFGRGEHFCLGAPLARLEAQIAVRRILAQLPGLRRANDQPLRWVPSPLVRGLQRLDVRWDT